MSDSFSDWTARVAEAWCVVNAIPCRRKFTDAELERPIAEVRRQMNYGEVMVLREIMSRHEGRADHDQDVFGRPLKAGT